MTAPQASPSPYASPVSGLHAFARAVAPRKLTTVSQWADDNLVLSTKGSAIPGRWSTSRNPPLKEPMDCLSARSHVQEEVLKFPIQFGKTMVAVAFTGYTMDMAPGPLMICLPGEVSMHKWIDQKLNPAIDETPAIARAMESVASRDSANRRNFKEFEGGQLYLEHAGSPARLKSTSVKYLVVDELDEFADNFPSGGGDPLEMLVGRTSAFPGIYKRLDISTPEIAGRSKIEERWLLSDQRHYHVPCPHCGHMQHLQWSGLRWTPGADGQVQRAVYVCCECGAEIEEREKTAMIAAGRWVPEHPERLVRGYTINCLYYQFGLGPRWAELAQKWVEAQADPAKLKTFINDRLAEVWEDQATRSIRHSAVADRAESYDLRTAPAGVTIITAGVDTQDNRLAVQLVGWGRGMGFWILDYVELPGDPAGDEVWTALTELLNTPIQHASGALMSVQAVAIDQGGHRGEDVKNFVRTRRVRRPMSIFGATAANAAVLGRGKQADVDWRGRTDKRGVVIYQAGTVAAKNWLFSRLSMDAERAAEARTTHFSDQLDSFYFQGLVSETFDPAKNRYVKRRGARNEPLDTWVYAFVAAHHPELRLHRWTAAQWERAEQRLTGAADAPPPEPAGHVPAAPAADGSRKKARGDSNIFAPISMT